MTKFKVESKLLKNTLLKDSYYVSIKEVFQRVANYAPDARLLADLDENKNIVYHTAKDVLEDVENLGNGLIKEGFENKHIAICADNCYLYVIADMSIAGGVGVSAPIDKESPEKLLELLLNRCDADAVICSSHLLSKIESIKQACPRLKTIITIDKKVDGYKFIREIMEVGGKVKENYYKNKPVDFDATCKIIFTSGTTGSNKGVELSQKNLTSNFNNFLDTIKTVEKEDKNTSYSTLPMHHSIEINTHIMPRIASARLTYINDSIKNLIPNMRIFKPHIIMVVPMIVNMIYKTIWNNIKKAGEEKKVKRQIKFNNFTRKFGINRSKKLFKKWFEPFTENLQEIMCGGAPLNPEVVKGMNELGIFIVNGFGITECSPLVSANNETYKDYASIGTACPKVTVKIDQPDKFGIGELLVKGTNVAKGYYKDDTATKQAFDEEGFFHTGDYASIDKKKRINLIGRKKNTIVLENGKNVFPEEIENEIENNMPYVKEVVVYASPYIRNGEENMGICAGLYIEENKPDEETIKKDFIKLNKQLSVYKRISYINLVDAPFERTSSKKIKRDCVYDTHKKQDGIII